MVTFCNTRVWSENLEKHFHLSKNLCSWRFCGTVIPWLMRCSWQAKDHIKQILRYMVHSIDKKIVKKFDLTLLLLYYKTVLWNFFWHFLVNCVLRIRAMRNRINQGDTCKFRITHHGRVEDHALWDCSICLFQVFSAQTPLSGFSSQW